MKRGRSSGGSKTGGTGDIKPQQLTLLSGVGPAVEQYVVSTLPLPVPRFGSQKNLSTIFEILYVDWYIGVGNLGDVSVVEWAYLSSAINRADGETSTQATLLADLADPRVFALAIQTTGTTTSGAFNKQLPIRVDMTDSNGNGYLIATDRISLVAGSAGNTVVSSSVAKVGYRLVNVGIEEYVGIVTSQQGVS